MTDHEYDDYLDGQDEAPVPIHSKQPDELIRRIVANPDDKSAWLAYSAELADNGHDDEALIVRELWPALRDSLLTRRSFDAVMANVRRNRNLLRAVAAQTAERRSTHGE